MKKKVELELDACDVCGQTIFGGPLTKLPDGTMLCTADYRARFGGEEEN